MMLTWCVVDEKLQQELAYQKRQHMAEKRKVDYNRIMDF